MGFDLSDMWNRATQQGKFGKYRQGGFMDNMNPFGTSSERQFSNLMNPLGNKNERTGDFLKKGKLWEGWQSSMADNPIGEKFEHDALKTGASKKQAMERGTGGAAAVVGSVLAAIFSGGSSAGAQAGAGSGGGAAASGTTIAAPTATTATTTGATTGATTGGGIGKTLGFSGEGGSFMKGMSNVSTLKDMFGGKGSSGGSVNMQQPTQQRSSTPSITDERKGVKREIKKDSDMPVFGKPKGATLKKKKETIKRRRP